MEVSLEMSFGFGQTSGEDNQTTKYKTTGERHKTVTKAVGRFIVKDLRPFSIVSNEGFKDMVEQLDPRYQLPSRTYFAETVIPNMYQECRADVISSLKDVPVALTTDGWTSRATQSYVTITTSHITEDWNLKSFVLQTRELPESHTGVNIAQVLTDAISEWGLNKNPPLVTDNAANMEVAAIEAGCIPHIGCYAHTLNLAAQRGLKVNSVSRILARVRRVVSFFHRSTTAAALLKEKTKRQGLKNVKLLQDVPTRWNSACDMLERFLELQPAIYAALVAKEIRSNVNDISTLSEADTTIAEDIVSEDAYCINHSSTPEEIVDKCLGVY
ncbi:E3 SUMO-protein ligase ZBED1-like [Gigantopelta aegis]|uniref:E3 SUMO-protein ligase ZBED1-like n=1 Tax=Gigantopelta aegis TaxID=1735272 RepID=UPI001B88AFCF|nr:E3 SUMO-protein ligase ZBED1-like [Gigantopelta aegis]